MNLIQFKPEDLIEQSREISCMILANTVNDTAAECLDDDASFK